MGINEILSIKRKWKNKYGRDAFNDTFLFESPEPMEFPTWEILKYDIIELKKIKTKYVKEINKNVFRLKLPTLIYFWIENNDHEIILAVSLERKPRGYAVMMTGKSNNYKNKSPYASDLYLAILKNLKSNLIFSDKTLSQSGFNVWKRLFNNGCKVLLYNTAEPGKSFVKINSENEMKKFYQQGKEFQNYRYVLSESLASQAETWALFRVRMHREINNLPLEE